MPLFSESPPAVTYGAMEPLLRTLSATEADTELVSLSDKRSLLLGADGYTSLDGYTLTRWAFDQTCRLACPGLNKVAVSLAETDYDEALATYNRVLSLRFDNKLYAHKMLVDNGRRTVEGVVGADYQWVSNNRLAEMLAGVAREGTKFLTAVVAGRWLLVRTVHTTPLVAGYDGWHLGWHTSSHDAGGASVKVAALLVRSVDRCSLLIPPTRGRVRHSGNTFEARLSGAFDRAADGVKTADQYAVAFAARERPLLTKRSHGLERLTALAERLVAAGMPRLLALRAVRECALRGRASQPVAQSVATMAPSSWARLTELDLVVALSRVAKPLSVPLREKVERLAYAMLMGEFSFSGD